MMENPNSWGKIRKAIHETILIHENHIASGIIGISLESKIYNSLFNRGWCLEDTNELVETYKVVARG